ncbi:hypothetical protein BVRB_7g172460 [Beta vulgaris subsp. vulgaris]|nr:hypothetical protein BVRB_7g172460 [Beta vulgaris subsp. vulgaris]
MGSCYGCTTAKVWWCYRDHMVHMNMDRQIHPSSVRF